ncbi:MAG TPA: 2-C-methyl-D-erythritol 4-phosphate cytidylyltransferase [Oscillatoriaceae cyanobacterium M33_DOE_052]|uniref:2-C-methyl-D-erythritol 4-phosphate cytidylyltransferase n=1 Tax=Planktothricoides sp. SpSt-374 TaxID=2282167 RepID=A0A7C3VJB6_9CYAN|nr:2-C-methyl-D-erythritol 4-phosphate cytidylyltransferase [Oscillatoriaceae cyanobacterium M33_DOE_052]
MHLLIPAAGMGRRMGSNRNKLLLTLLGDPLLAWTLRAAEASTQITWIGIIAQPEDKTEFEDILAMVAPKKPVCLLPGGVTRQESVYNGLQGLPVGAVRVLIHDGARCLATPQLFDRCAEALRPHREYEPPSGIVAAVPVKDTIKVVDRGGVIEDTPDRSRLWAAQTPQGFPVPLLKDCHEKGLQSGWEVTDDAALFEKCGLAVRVVPGEETNLKVTTPSDLALAEFILKQRQLG